MYERIGRFITSYSAQNADYLMNAVSKRNWKPGTAKEYKIKTTDAAGNLVEISGETWADEAAALSAQGKLVFDKDRLSGDLPGCMRQMLNREAVAIISGHDELLAKWRREHQKWLAERAEWEAKGDHQKYLALRPRFDAFEKSAGGKAGKRRGRWHVYLAWLRSNPDLAAWRGGPPVVHVLTSEALDRIRKAKRWKTRSVEAQEFWAANPELHDLDSLHGHYERTFVRRRKTKRNRDGFDHPPTFTMPNAVTHPRWFVFNAPQTNPSGYRALQLPLQPQGFGKIELQLLTADANGDEEYPSGWISVAFRSDPRLGQFRRVKVPTIIKRGKAKGQTKTKDGFEFFDRHLRRWRPAEISGVKLMFRDVRLNSDGSLRTASAFLVFTCSTDDLPLTDLAGKINWTETGVRRLPNGLVACAVDLGLRHVGFATLCIYEHDRPRVLRSRNIWLDQEAGGPDLAHIGRHKREIRRLRRLRGKPVRGEDSHVELQDHITHMGEDRFKKAARAIINFALNTDDEHDKQTGEVHSRADVIVLEKLEGFIPDAERERGINRSLVAWNRGQLVNRLNEMAADAGYKGRVFEVYPAGTSQVCSKCGALGRRYSIVRDDETSQPDIRFGWVEKLFACPACGYRANSDHNASVNLHRKFIAGESAVDAFSLWRGKSKADRHVELNQLDTQLRGELLALHGFAPPGIESHF